MSNNSNPNYFRLGVFVLAAIGVLLAVILIFGSGQIFKKSFYVETYIKQSVTGLDAGASVRFRGVKIGQVTMIGLSGDMYERDLPFHDRRQYVVVRMQIFGDKVNEDQIGEFVKNNLRARVKSMGITFVIVSHELASIYAIADKVIMLDKDSKGIIAEGDPKVLRDTSKDPRVHQFFNRIMSKDAA